jgi:hypothetical protein
MKRLEMYLLVAVGWLLVSAAPAQAYIGPGAGISVLGTVMAFLGAVFFAIIGFIWYPLKRLLLAVRSFRRAKADHETSTL